MGNEEIEKERERMRTSRDGRSAQILGERCRERERVVVVLCFRPVVK